jgi:DNA-binding CsgD family transcriptional regulator
LNQNAGPVSLVTAFFEPLDDSILLKKALAMSDLITLPAPTFDDLITGVGTAALAPAMFAVAKTTVGAVEIFGYILRSGHVPHVLVSAGSVGNPIERVKLYSQNFHRYDPAIAQAGNRRFGRGHIGRTATSEIKDRDYRLICFEKPRFAEKWSCVRSDRDTRFVFSVYRRHGAGLLESEGFSELAKVAMPILRKHWQLTSQQAGITPLQRLFDRLQQFFPELTLRERQVCGKTLMGMTATEIGDELGIGKATVLTYRRRAYERYGFATANQFLHPML